MLTTGLMYKSLMNCGVVSNVYRSCVPNKTTFTNDCLTQWISKLPGSFGNSLSEAVFHGSGGHSKHNCLQDQANFHLSQAWPIVLIITRGPFGLRVLSLPVSVCVCVCLSVCQLLLVRTITRHPFKLGSPNLNQKMQSILLKVPIVLGAD